MLNKIVKPGLAVAFFVAFISAPAFAQVRATAPVQPDQAAETLPPAESIIARHIKAVGGREAIKAHNSVTAKGTISMPANGISGTLELFTARPNKNFMKMTLPGIGDISSGYDGKVAWTTSPMTGPMLATGKELEEKALDSDFEGALGFDSKYDSMKTLEKTTFEGRPVYKVALKRKGNAGEDIEFYDVETGLKAGAIIERSNPMGVIKATSVISDYKKFGDLLHPTVIKQTASGAQMVMTFTSIEYDNVDPAVFELPAEIKALVK